MKKIFKGLLTGILLLSLTLSVAGCEKCSNNSSGNGAGELIGTA